MYFALALLAVLVSAIAPLHRLPVRIPAKVERILSRSATVPVAVVMLVSAQHAYLVLLWNATYHQHPMRDFMARMPVRFVSSLAADNLAESYRSGFALLVLLEAAALVALYFGLARPTRGNLASVAVGMLLAYADAAFARAGTSADAYAYVGFALLGTHAYAPPSIAFNGQYALINVWWHTPLVSAPYGPLWLAIAEGICALGHTLFEKILALRLLGALTLLGTAGVLSALGVRPRVTALVALNPALIFEFIANVHNDLFGVLLLLLARYAMSRDAPRLAIACAVGAGLIKLPFLLIAALAFTSIPSRPRRLAMFAISLALGVSVSWIVGGRHYVAALHRAADEGTAGHALSTVLGASVALKLVAAGSLGLALWSGIFVEGCAWMMPALSALLHPWYLCWTLPYAVTSEGTLRNAAVALPIAMLLCDGALGHGYLVNGIAGLAYLWLTLALIRPAGRFAQRERRV